MRRIALPLAAAVAVSFGLLGGVSAARPATHPAVESHRAVPTLGVKHAEGAGSKGWGQVRPKALYNGGDANGLVSKIHWSRWGGTSARGKGMNAIFKPKGGYYSREVVIKLTASKIKLCPSTGRPAYTKLVGQEPKRPGGPEGKKFTWNANLCHRI